MKPIHHKTMERRRSILAGFKILATTAFLLLFLLILCLLLMMAGNHFDAKLDDLQGDIGQMRWELENLRRENELLREELEGLRQGQQEWLERFEVRDMEATGYTLACGTGDGFTATMTRPEVGRTIAVDPGVIPYGSRVWIDGEGPYVAEDTGFLIKGDRIDIYMGEGQEAYRTAMRWGRQEVQIIYERGKEL